LTLRLLGLASAGALWGVAVWLLLASAVPGDLSLPAVDVDAVFGAAVVSEAERYQRVALALWAGSQAALLGTLWLYARHGAAFMRESAGGRIATGMLLGMLGLGIVWLVQLPFGLAGHWWGRRHGLTEAGYLEWAFGDWAYLGGAFLSICLALLIVMALAGFLGERWWLPGAAVFVALGALFVFAGPYLAAPETEPLRDRELLAAVRRFERDQGLPRVPVRVEDVSGETSQANAFAAGFGPTRQIVLWSTLLDERFERAEVETVLAHELGHHSSEHILKALAWYALFAVPGAYLLMRATRGRGGMARPEAVPLALLVLALLTLAAAPAENVISRRMEAEADWKALGSTRDPAAARRLFVSFAETSLGDPSPPGWAYVLLGTHPTLEQRVAMAEAWARLQPPAP
jgi:STE24 endopeptidase